MTKCVKIQNMKKRFHDCYWYLQQHLILDLPSKIQLPSILQRQSTLSIKIFTAILPSSWGGCSGIWRFKTAIVLEAERSGQILKDIIKNERYKVVITINIICSNCIDD